jgi:hypothetical protein
MRIEVFRSNKTKEILVKTNHMDNLNHNLSDKHVYLLVKSKILYLSLR